MISEKQRNKHKKIKNIVIIFVALFIGFYCISAVVLNPYNTRYESIARKINKSVLKKQSYHLKNADDQDSGLYLIVKSRFSKEMFSKDDISNAYHVAVEIADLVNENKQNYVLPDQIIIQIYRTNLSVDGNFRITISIRDNKYIVEEASLRAVCSFTDLEGLSGINQIWFGDPGTVNEIDFFSEFTNLEQITFGGWLPDVDTRQGFENKFHSMLPDCKIIWPDSK